MGKAGLLGRAGPRALAALVLVALSGCASSAQTGEQTGDQGERVITVFAAASLTDAFEDLATRFEAANPGTRVRLSFGSSTTLATQIAAGAPADVFAAASTKAMDIAVAGGPDSAAKPVVFARNAMQIAVPADNPAEVDDLADLADPAVKVALCAPTAPCGALGAAVLARAGLTVRPVTEESDVRATMAKVSLGEVDAALVYVTDVASADPAKVRGVSIPAARNLATDYPIVVLPAVPTTAGAKAFVDLVLSTQGREVLSERGFQAP